jgi:transketolase
MRMLKPADTETILVAARRSKLLVTVEDHFQTGGLYTIVAETLVEHGVMAKVLPIALKERWFKPALMADLLEYEGFTGTAIAARITDQLNTTAS